MKLGRRTFLQIGTGAVIASAAHSCVQSNQTQSTQSQEVSTNHTSKASTKIKIGFWPIVAGLPLYLAVEKGYFKEAGLEVEAVKFAGAQQVVEGLIAGRNTGSAFFTGREKVHSLEWQVE